MPPGVAAADILLPALYDVAAFNALLVQMTKAVHAVVINMKAFTAKQLPDAAVAKTLALQYQLSDAP